MHSQLAGPALDLHAGEQFEWQGGRVGADTVRPQRKVRQAVHEILDAGAAPAGIGHWFRTANAARAPKPGPGHLCHQIADGQRAGPIDGIAGEYHPAAGWQRTWHIEPRYRRHRGPGVFLQLAPLLNRVFRLVRRAHPWHAWRQDRERILGDGLRRERKQHRQGERASPHAPAGSHRRAARPCRWGRAHGLRLRGRCTPSRRCPRGPTDIPPRTHAGTSPR